MAMNNAKFKKMAQARERYHKTAMQIPGVHGTSVGLKTVKGKLTREFAILIHLTKKRPSKEVPPDERIPKEIEGFPTDVIEHDQPEPCSDGGKRRPVLGGVQIAIASHYGTLGCIVKDAKKDVYYALSNQHVMTGVGSGVFQPKTDPVCDKIGETKKSILSARIDGAICSLDSNGVTWTAEILDLNGVTGKRTITWSDLPYAVKKRGRTTLLTKGQMISVNYSGTRSDGWHFQEQQYIQSDSGNFVEPGDSGSALVDHEVKVVGLVWGMGGSSGMASPIDYVLSELDIEIVKYSPKQETPYRETVTGQLETLLCATERGKDYWRAYRRHHDRVVHMFHCVPRLYAVWLKLPQAKLVEVMMKALNNPETKVPSMIGPMKTVEVVDTLRRAVKRYATDDEEFKRQIDEIYKQVSANIGKPWRKVLAD